MRARALLFVMVASVVLASLGSLQWWHLGGGGSWGLHGTSAGLTSFGDGKVAIVAAAAAFALAYFGAVRRIHRSLAGVGICLVACLMFALCLGDIVHPPRSALGFIPDAGGYHATIWLNFTAALSLAIGLAGAYIATPAERRLSHRQHLRRRGSMGVTPVKALLIFAMLASLALAALSVQTWADLRIDLRLGGLLPPEPVRGTQLTALTNAGDGRVLLLGSIMTLALSVVGILSHESRRLASAGVALAGAGMLVLTVYVATHLQRGGDLEYWATGTKFDYGATIVPYLAIASAFVIAVAGALAFWLKPEEKIAPDERLLVDRPTVRSTIERIGLRTQNALRVLMWLGAALAVLAFVPWIDANTLNISADGPRSMTALSDAVLFASVALGCAFLAWQMLRDPSELVWAGLVVAGGVLFVFAGAEITESTQACESNGTVLVFPSAGFGCFRQGGYTLSAGQVVLWVVLSVSALVAALALALPIIEMNSRERAN